MTLLFNACAQVQTSEALDLVKRVSSKLSSSLYSNTRLANSLLDALIKCGDCTSAQAVFARMKRCVIGCGNLMNGWNRENHPEKTLALFDWMKNGSIKVDFVIYLCVIKALAQTGMLPLSKKIVEQIPKSLFNDSIRTALIDMWVRFSASYSFHSFLKDSL